MKSGRARWGLRIGLAVLALAGFAAVPARADTPAGPSFVDAGGLHVEAVTQIDDRQYDVSVSTPSLGRAVDVRILVPSDYSTTATPLPVLYLFHGTSGRASDWVRSGNAEQTTAGKDLIVVMPDAGFDGDGGGWFTNWVDTSTVLGPSQWETFHIDELIPWVDANLRTIADRSGRAIAGLSQGGFGSTTYAARHPDLFASAAAFSGAPDIDYNPMVALGATAVIEGTAFGLDGVQPEAMFGSRAMNEINWQGHDPATLVTNLSPVDVWLYTATGAPGAYDNSAAPNFGAMGIEFLTHSSTISFVQRAQQLGVPVHLDNYVYGTHSWAYWADDLNKYLGPLMQTFEHPHAPTVVGYESVDQSWTQWGWSVSVTRTAAQQFTSMSKASAAGFTLAGTGTASVVTPALYAPGSSHVATIAGAPATLVADASGRLHITVALGPDIPVPAVMGVPTPTPFSATVTIS